MVSHREELGENIRYKAWFNLCSEFEERLDDALGRMV